MNHEGPRRVAAGQLGAARPAQRRQHRRRQAVEREAPVRVRNLQRRGLVALHTQHRAEHDVRPVRREALQPRLPGFEIEVLEVGIRIVGRHVDGLRDRRVDERRDRSDHRLVRLRAHLERSDEGRRQRRVRALQMPIQTPGMIFDRVLLEVAVGHALLARVGPAERRLDAIARVVGEGEADGAGRRDRQQMRVAQAVRADAVLQGLRQARCEVVAAQKEIGVEQRKRTALARKLDRRVVGGVAQCLRDAPRHRERLRRVVAQPEHRERIAEPREAEAHAALAARFVVLLRQRPYRHVEHVVEHANGDAREIRETRIVEARVLVERVDDEARQVDRAEAATAIGGQRLLATRIGRSDRLAIRQVVVAVDRVEEQHAGLGVVIGRSHDLVPQLARTPLAIDP